MKNNAKIGEFSMCDTFNGDNIEDLFNPTGGAIISEMSCIIKSSHNMHISEILKISSLVQILKSDIWMMFSIISAILDDCESEDDIKDQNDLYLKILRNYHSVSNQLIENIDSFINTAKKYKITKLSEAS